MPARALGSMPRAWWRPCERLNADAHGVECRRPGSGSTCPQRHRQRASPEARALGSEAERCAISWTGGKDCNLALLAWRDPKLGVVALVTRPEDAEFKAHPLSLMEAQSRLLPLLRSSHARDAPSYKEAYVAAAAA